MGHTRKRRRTLRCMPPRPRADPLQTLAVLAVVGFVLMWVSYLWEKTTGMTFVVGRQLRRYGDVSSAAHLSQTLHDAEFVTFLCAVYLVLWFVLLRPSRSTGAPR